MNYLWLYLIQSLVAAALMRGGVAAIHASWDLPGVALIAVGVYLLYIGTIAYRGANRSLEDAL